MEVELKFYSGRGNFIIRVWGREWRGRQREKPRERVGLSLKFAMNLTLSVVCISHENRFSRGHANPTNTQSRVPLWKVLLPRFLCRFIFCGSSYWWYSKGICERIESPLSIRRLIDWTLSLSHQIKVPSDGVRGQGRRIKKIVKLSGRPPLERTRGVSVGSVKVRGRIVTTPTRITSSRYRTRWGEGVCSISTADGIKWNGVGCWFPGHPPPPPLVHSPTLVQVGKINTNHRRSKLNPFGNCLSIQFPRDVSL